MSIQNNTHDAHASQEELNMKKYLALLLVLVMVLSLAACGSTASSAASWTFRPARRGDKDIPLTVRIPVRFMSAMVSVPPAPEKQVMADMKEKEEQAAERSGHPSFTVKLFIDRNGKMSAPPVIEKEGPSLSGEDFKILSSYIERSLRQWTFAPARNPDGEAIDAETAISITV